MQTVENALKNDANRPSKLAVNSIDVAPEEMAYPTSGQYSLRVSPNFITTHSPESMIRIKSIEFAIAVIGRVRDLPEDRFGNIYLEETHSLSDMLEFAINVIETTTVGLAWQTALNAKSSNQYELRESAPVLLSATYDPIHLYSSDFFTRKLNSQGNIDEKMEEREKISGFKLNARFRSPKFSLTDNPIGCD